MRLLTLPGVLLLAFACTSAPEAPTPSLAAAWDRGTSHLVTALESIPEKERWLAIRSLLQSRPQASEDSVCDHVAPDHRSSCESYSERIRERPHLWGEAHQRHNLHQERPKVQGPPRKPESGPATTRVSPPAGTLSKLLSLHPVQTSCDTQDAQCRIREAQAAVQLKKRERAAQICLDSGPTWQAECFFRMGEMQARRGSQRLEPAGLSWAVDYCLAAQSFATECLEQTLIAYWLTAPPSSQQPSAQWDELKRQADNFLGATLAVDSNWKQNFIDKYWAGLLHHSYQRSSLVTEFGSPVEFPSKDVHVRSAAAFRWVQQTTPHPPNWGTELSDLDHWTNELLAQLKVRPDESIPEVSFTKIDYRDHWQEDARGDESFSATSYLGSSRRTWSDDPFVDAQLALLEAFARHKVAEGLLIAASSHPTERVAWTARRLRNAAGLP